MLKKGQMIQGSVAFLDDMQNGVIKFQKDQIFVRHVLPKEEVKVRIVKPLKKGYAADLVEVLKASKDRAKVKCPIYERCGSCQLLHMNNCAETSYKEAGLKTLCKEHKNLQLRVSKVLDMEEPYHYRNKMIIGFTKDRNHRIQAGFYEEFSHRIVPYTTCLLHPHICDEIVSTIVRLMQKFKIEPYDEDRRRGLFRHVLLRYGEVSKQIMVVLVLNNALFPARKAFTQELLKAHPEISTIVQNVNTRKTSVVLGDQEKVLYGSGFIEDTLCDLKFRISARSFYQINHEQTQVLYKTAIDMLNLTGQETILDAYCGIGTIGMYAAQFAKQVLGVEINKDAIQDAKKNAQANGIRNIRFVCDDASAFMRKMAQKKERLEIVIMDPPRNGSDEQFIKSVAFLKPKQVLYISCNPQTQMRDLQVFQKLGYHGEEITGVNLFPHTFHVESVVRLSRTK